LLFVEICGKPISIRLKNPRRRFALIGMAGEGYKKPAFRLRQQQQKDYSDHESWNRTAVRKAMNEYWRHNRDK